MDRRGIRWDAKSQGQFCHTVMPACAIFTWMPEVPGLPGEKKIYA